MDLQEQVYSFQQHIIEESKSQYESFLRKLIATVLKKEEADVIPEIDATRFSFVHHELHPGRRFIGFDGNMLGEEVFTIESDLDNGIVKAKWEFIPKTVID